MKMNIEFSCDSDAFDDIQFPGEVERVLGTVIRRIHSLYAGKPTVKVPENSVIAPVEVGVLLDYNGNVVGSWTLDYEGGSR